MSGLLHSVVLAGEPAGLGYKFEAVDATFSTEKFGMALTGGCSIQVEWTGDLVGTFTLETSNWENPGTWIDESDTSEGSGVDFPAQPAGSAGVMVLHAGNMRSLWGRVTFTRTSGSGTVLILVRSKANG
jgi:hypothetical protein